MESSHEILRRADRRPEDGLGLGRPPRAPGAVRAAAAPVEPRSCSRRTRPHRTTFAIDPAAFVEKLLGIDLADVRRPLAAELHPGRLVLRRDERERAAQLAHTRGAPDAMREPVR